MAQLERYYSMALHPQAKAILDLITAANRPATRDLPLAEGRAAYQASVDIFDTDKPQVHRVEDRSFTGPAGEVPLRVYWPRESDDALPILVYLHGGGWVIGDLDTHDRLCRRLASGGDCIVVSVDYRLAPEHVFPSALEDVCTAYHWLLEKGIAPDRIAFLGESTGGRLVLSALQSLRDSGAPLPATARRSPRLGPISACEVGRC